MSFYTSLNGLKNAQTDLGVIAHNIANVETNGFKKGRTEFADIVVASARLTPSTRTELRPVASSSCSAKTGRRGR